MVWLVSFVIALCLGWAAGCKEGTIILLVLVVGFFFLLYLIYLVAIGDYFLFLLFLVGSIWTVIRLMATFGEQKYNQSPKVNFNGFIPLPGQDNVRAFIDYIYRDYDGDRSKAIANLHFNYKTEKGRKKIAKAINSYSPNIRPEQVICVFDTTLFGGTDDGFLMTDKMICVHNKYESETFTRFYPQIQTITLRERGRYYDIWLNDGEPNAVRIDTGIMKDYLKDYRWVAERLLSLIRLVWETFGPATTIKEISEDTNVVQENTVSENVAQPVVPMTTPTTDVQQVVEGGPTKKEEIGKKKQMVKCPACGEQNPPDTKLCDECGAFMEPPKEQKKCPACGAVVEDDEKFCTECGAVIETWTVCPNCGGEVKEGKKFCGKCGTKLM